ncbi:universal stress protein [Brachybacterium sp. AOP25-B2-12]|uniref:universal stress protein n=1 Tax=Brachybacterium sp. AOP25-B2-12 TaxID=3457710 RepID=UPI0040341D96
METTDPRPASSETPLPALTDRPRVVVGIADTDESDRAVTWGADHARRIGGTLHLVHAFVWPLMNVDVEPVPGIAGSGLRAATEHLVAHAVEVARTQSPGLPVTSSVVDGRGVDVLLAASQGAEVLAVGSRGLGRVLALVMGSTSLALARNAHCPVVVVRGEELTDGPIGVSYEATDLGTQALRRAGDLAALHGTEVHVVVGIAAPQAEHGRIVDQARALIAADHPEVRVEPSAVTSARDARQLIRASEGDRMVVVAARSAGAASASSQTVAVVQHARTPIWIERPLGAR